MQQALRSISDQTFNDWEAIVIDDNSTDDTKKMMDEIFAKDPRIKFFIKPTGIKKGPANSRNLGLQKSSGEYIIFLDSDDMLMPYCLQQRFDAIEKFPANDGWIFNGAAFKNNNTSVPFLWNVSKSNTDLERFFALDVPWQTTGPIWRKNALTKLKLQWDAATEPMDDVDFHINILLHEEFRYKVFWDSNYDYLFRTDSSDSISQTDYFNPQKVEARFYFFSKYCNSLPQKKMNLLRPVLLYVLRTCVVVKKYSQAYSFISLAKSKQIITSYEKIFLRFNILKMQMSRNRIFKFPGEKSKTIFCSLESFMLQVPVSALQNFNVERVLSNEG